MPGLFGVISNDATATTIFKRLVAETQTGIANEAETLEDGPAKLGCTYVPMKAPPKAAAVGGLHIVADGYFTSAAILKHPEYTISAPARIIAQGYNERGDTYFQDLSGTFSLAIWKKDSETLHLVTDLMGFRPIYYAKLRDGIAFASDMETLVRAGSLDRRVDIEAVSDFFVHNYVMGEKSFIASARLVPPGSILTWREGKIEIAKYADLPYPRKYERRGEQELDEEIDVKIGSAVRRLIVPGLRYGLSLSGGMDSRWLAIHLRDAPTNVTSYTFGSGDSDDARIAAQVARELGIPNVRLDLDSDFIASHGDAISRMTGGMYNLKDSQEYPLGVRLAGQIDVNIGGMLGDILFGHEMNPVYKRISISQLRSYWMWRTKKLRLPKALMEIAFGKKAAHEMYASALKSLQTAIDRAPCTHAYQVAQYVNLRERQRRFINVAQLLKLAYTDVRHPLADREVISLALSIEPSQLMMERAYRRSMVNRHPKLGSILWTYTLQPPSASVTSIYAKRILQVVLGKPLRNIRLRGKPAISTQRGFASYDTWTRTVLRPYIETALFSDAALALKVFDVAGLRRLVDLHMSGAADLTGFICQALSLATWARGWSTSAREF